MQSAVEQFLTQFLTPPKGTSQATIAEKVKHWISICNHPEQVYPNADSFELRYHRRNARQNVRRLLSKHPELVQTVTRLLQQSEERQ